MNRQTRPVFAVAALATLFAVAGAASAAVRAPGDGHDRHEQRQDHRKDRQEARQDHRADAQDARQDRRADAQDARQDRRADAQDARQDRRGDRQDFRQGRRNDPVARPVVVQPRVVQPRVVQPRVVERRPIQPRVVQQRHDARRDVRTERHDTRRVAYDRYRADYDRRVHDFRARAIPRYYVRPAHYRYFYGGQWYNTSNYGADVLRQAVSWGYQEGIRAGRADRRDGWAADLRDSVAWRNGGYGYGGRYVSRADYDYYFRQGFQRGYDDGYYGRMQYGRYDNGDSAMIAEAVLVTILGFQLLR